MSQQPTIAFNDGRAIPQLGLGVWQTPDDVAEEAVATALRAGYRHVDTASAYNNEHGVGEGLRRSGLDRDEVFVTTKLKNDDQGFDSTLRAFDASLERLGLDAVDLYLIHWPSPWRGSYVDTWKAFVRLKEEGRARSIGVSNFAEEHLERIVGETGVTPVLNQIELHPRFQQVELRAWLDENGIATESWSPLGQAQILKDETIAGIARKHDRSPAQIVIRWHLDQGIVTIPRATDRGHMVDNLSVGGFALDDEDMAAIAALDDPDGRIGPDPTTFTAP